MTIQQARHKYLTAFWSWKYADNNWITHTPCQVKKALEAKQAAERACFDKGMTTKELARALDTSKPDEYLGKNRIKYNATSENMY